MQVYAWEYQMAFNSWQNRSSC